MRVVSQEARGTSEGGTNMICQQTAGTDASHKVQQASEEHSRLW